MGGNLHSSEYWGRNHVSDENSGNRNIFRRYSRSKIERKTFSWVWKVGNVNEEEAKITVIKRLEVLLITVVNIYCIPGSVLSTFCGFLFNTQNASIWIERPRKAGRRCFSLPWSHVDKWQSWVKFRVVLLPATPLTEENRHRRASVVGKRHWQVHLTNKKWWLSTV